MPPLPSSPSSLGTSVWILGDQLLVQHPALSSNRTVIMVESLERLRHRRYHARKLVLILAAMRHYADALRERGYTVELRQAASFYAGVREHLVATGNTHVITMAAAEYDTRQMQHRLADMLSADLGYPITVEVLPNTQFLVAMFPPKRSPKLMEPFYRHMRQQTGLLMTSAGEPEGGKWNYDADNRKPFDGRSVPPLPTFAPDAVTRTAMQDVAQHCPHVVGDPLDFDLPVTHAQAQAALADFITQRLPNFGQFEDAMAHAEPILYHSVLAMLVNIGLLEPLPMATAATRAYYAGTAPLNSVEGFVRQVIGWREYIYYRYWELMPDLRKVNAWGHTRALPEFFWTGATHMRCMQHTLRRILATGYTHHIERLMLLCNFALLAELEPQQVNDWFMACFVDAYEWVMLPNVLGMGLNADGGKTATKPYLASANYINKMSDFCKGCGYNHKARIGDAACPFNTLYWHFLLKHELRLRANPRFGPAVLGVSRIAPAERAAIVAQAQALLTNLDQL